MSKKAIVLIDEYCSYKTGSVFCKNGVFYACTLNQTDINTNANKFYIMQLVVSDKKYIYYVRYGRIGEVGKISHLSYDSESLVTMQFSKQFRSKTGNSWDQKDKFVKKPGKYFLTEVAYDEVKDIDKVSNMKESKNVVSKLDPNVLKFIEMISDINMMKNSLIKLDIDTKKLPLGKISNTQIDRASNLLKNIKDKLNVETQKNVDMQSDDSDENEEENRDDSDDIYTNKKVKPVPKSNTKKINKKKQINNDVSDSDDNEENDMTFANLSSEFYTYIPIACGRRKPPIIGDAELLGKYVAMLDELRNMVVAVKILDDSQKDTQIHPADNVYASLKTNIQPLNKNSEMWKHITDYVKNTHAVTHHYKIELLEIYEIQREGEKQIYDNYTKNIGNRMLLYHGSRMSNFCSILKNGLVLNPEMLMPGVYISGKMFGYGNYSACSISKSFNYCDVSSSNGIGALLLCEYALGKQLCLTSADTTLNAQKVAKGGYNSTWGMGSSTPSSSVTVNDVVIPNGPLCKSKKNSSLLYDEFIVYDQRQIYQRYLILVKNISDY